MVIINHVYWICDSHLLCLSFFLFFISENMCTVVYFDDCVSIRQCKLYCESMGGSKYRWFHNACCQCIGPECVDYGSKAVKCMNCLFWSAGTYWYQMSGPYQRTEGRGNYDCDVLAFLSYLVKYPPPTPSYPCKLFLFCCYVSLYIFRYVFNSVFY